MRWITAWPRRSARLVAESSAATREDDQSRSLWLQVVDLLGLQRAVEGDPAGVSSLRGGLSAEMTFFGQHDSGEHRGLLITERVRGQMDDLILAYLVDERAFGGLPPAENQAMRVEGLDSFKLIFRGRQGLEFRKPLLIEAGIVDA